MSPGQGAVWGRISHRSRGRLGYALWVSRGRTVLGLLVAALVVRALLMGWDSGLLSPHPDERQVAFVTERVSSWRADPEFSAYGSLHFFAIRGLCALLGMERSYPGFLHAGRLLSLLASFAALLLGFWLARRAWGERTAVLFILLAAVTPLDLQQSHFATVEAHHAFLVLAALAAAWWLAWRGGVVAAALAGVAAGASLAVKVSSLPLVLAVAVALLMVWRRVGMEAALAAASTAAAGALAAFAAGQPSAFPVVEAPLLGAVVLAVAGWGWRVASRREETGRQVIAAASLILAVAGVSLAVWNGLRHEYLQGVLDQVAMATGRADLAYVRVYRHTLPVLYPLRELGIWGLGPGLLLAAAAGATAASRRAVRGMRRWLEGEAGASASLGLVLLAWVVPMALRLLTLRVKYLRYWEPLVLPLALVAAWWLGRLPRRWRRRAVTAAVTVTLLWGVAYLCAFTAPHPHLQAAAWLGDRLQPGQTVAFEHWDEGLGLAGDVRRTTLTPYDLPDDAAKTHRLLRALAGADWVVMTSNRIRRTVLANEDRFPRTARLYRLLLTGRAGFEPVTRFDRSPRLLGLRLPVELADESFVNYEMPRVLVLRRTGVVDAETLAARLERPVPFLEGLSAGGLERWITRRVPPARAPRGAAGQLVDLVAFLAVLAAAAGAAWLLLLPWLGALPDAGLGLAAATGWAALGWLLWLGSEAAILAPGPQSALLLVAVAWVAALARTRGRPGEAARLISGRRRGLGMVAALMAGVFVLFLAARLWNPAVWWGEKPMDLTFLNAFLHAGHWPPGEPWMAGMPLHYYALGEGLAAAPLLAGGVGSAVGYNLMVAALPALAAGVLAGLGLALARRRGWLAAMAGPGVLLLMGNLDWPFHLDLLRAGRLFDAWWATSRVIPGFAIDEYPLWTALFADLHAHFLALPVLLAALGWGWLLLRPGQRRPLVPALMTGVLAGILAATNPWDLPVLTAALAVGLVTSSGRRRRFAWLLLAALVAAAAAAPFLVELSGWLARAAGGAGVVLNRGEHAPAWALLRHLGQFLLPLAVGAVAVLGRRAGYGLVAAAGAAGAGLVLGSSSMAVSLGCAALLVAAAVVAAGRRARMAFLLAALGAAVVAGCEVITVMDRMNTLFKFYNGAWLLLGGGLVGLLVDTRGLSRRAVTASWFPLGMVALLALPLGIWQGWREPRVRSPRPTLDGEAYLAGHDPSTAWLVQGLAAAARPGDVVAEAAGPSYQEYTRIAMHTGLPTVVGWDWHLVQRGQDRAEIESRRKDLELLYGGADTGQRRAVLDRYRVRWVVLGDLERRTYGVESEDPLAGVPGVVTLCVRGSDRLYLVKPRCTGEGNGGSLPPAVATARGAAGTVSLLPGGGVVLWDADGVPVRALPAPPGAAGVAWWGDRPAVVTPAGVLVLDRAGVWTAVSGGETPLPADPGGPR